MVMQTKWLIILMRRPLSLASVKRFRLRVESEIVFWTAAYRRYWRSASFML